jgi:hypothetical protein
MEHPFCKEADMGSPRGPIPKRSDQRRRRNKPDVPLTKAASNGEVYGPPLAAGHKHSAPSKRFYESLRHSGQAQFYEASDWEYAADVICTALDAYHARPSAAMLASLTHAMGPLLITEGDRRRARLELERVGNVGEEETSDAADLDEHRRRLRACD